MAEPGKNGTNGTAKRVAVRVATALLVAMGIGLAALWRDSNLQAQTIAVLQEENRARKVELEKLNTSINRLTVSMGEVKVILRRLEERMKP